MVVYYVTASPMNSTTRMDLGKFFDRAHAEAYAEGLGSRWRKPLIEAREEAESDQHPAHADVVAGLK